MREYKTYSGKIWRFWGKIVAKSGKVDKNRENAYSLGRHTNDDM